MKLNLPLDPYMENKNPAKSKKEQIDKEIENWPKQIESMIKEIQKKNSILNESSFPNYKTKEEARSYFHSRPFSEFLKEWLK